MSIVEDALWASLPVPALVLDETDRIRLANPAAEGLLMASARALEGQLVWDRLALDAGLDAALNRARADNAALFVSDVGVVVGPRPPVPCNLQIAPLAGRPGRMLVLISPREMAGLVGQGRAAGVAARSAIGLAEMLAHEIKNPLAGITGAAQLLSMSLKGADRELTELIVSEARRIVALLDRVGAVGNRAEPRLAAVNIHDVLDRVRRSAEVGMAAHMRLIADYDPSLPPVHGDADELVQVFDNLVRNAAEAAGPGGGTITLRSFYEPALRRRGDGGAGRPLPVQVEIIDDGPGVPPAIADAVFDPFVSGRETGTGLGLALAARIVSDHDGWIAVASVPGRTVFRVSLPLADAGEAD